MDTVSHIQKDMAILREENRLLRTPATSQVVQAPRRAALTTTKVLIGNNIIRCFKQLCGRTAGTMILQHFNCSRI